MQKFIRTLGLNRILALVCLGLIPWTFSSCNKTPASSIEYVLKKDKEYGESSYETKLTQLNSVKDFDDVAKGMRKYVASSRSLDLRDCPQEFVVAYIDHLRAWEDAAQAMAAHPAYPANTPIPFRQFYLGEVELPPSLVPLHRQFVEYWERNVENEEKIKISFRKVEDIALRHGAKLP